MTAKLVEQNRELTLDELHAVSGGDKLGNFQVQGLMSAFNQAETLASSVLKHAHDTQTSIIGKI